MKLKINLRNLLQHRLNPLHIYSRLVDWGMGKEKAKRRCAAYERIYRLFL